MKTVKIKTWEELKEDGIEIDDYIESNDSSTRLLFLKELEELLPEDRIVELNQINYSSNLGCRFEEWMFTGDKIIKLYKHSEEFFGECTNCYYEKEVYCNICKGQNIIYREDPPESESIYVIKENKK